MYEKSQRSVKVNINYPDIYRLSTGLFKWKKDYIKASMYLEEAAINYKNGKGINSAIKAY